MVLLGSVRIPRLEKAPLVSKEACSVGGQMRYSFDEPSTLRTLIWWLFFEDPVDDREDRR